MTSPTSRPTADAAVTASRATRRGFTLIEMIVVLGVIMLLMGIALGGLFKLLHTNPILAAEQTIAGAIRQARYTARSSGTPVVLELHVVPDPPATATGATVSGISREMLVNVDYDAGSKDLGVSGGGLYIKSATVDRPPPAINLLADPLDATQILRSRRLIRGHGGFYLSCAVRPPAVRKVTGEVPLLLIGEDNADVTTSIAGLMLRRHDVVEQSRRAPTPNPPGPPPMLSTYEILGWIGGDPFAANAELVSSLDPSDIPDGVARDEQEFLLAPPDKLGNRPHDVAEVMAGDRWEQIGLLYDRRQLVLYRNGRRVGVHTVTTPLAAPDDDHYHLSIGIAQLAAAPAATVAGECRFDDVRVDRLAIDQLTPLPRGIVPCDAGKVSADFRIVAHPEGRVEVTRLDSANGGTIVHEVFLTDVRDDSKLATLDISDAGRVTSSLQVSR